MRTFLCVFIFVLCFLSGPAHSADKYVNCSGGNDDNDGSTAGEAWKTIGKAAEEADPGDLVHITNGPCTLGSPVAFDSRLTLSGTNNCRSTESECTVFRGEPSTSPIVVRPGSTSGIDGFRIRDGVAHLKFDNFSFQANGTSVFNEPVIIGVLDTKQESDIFFRGVSISGAHKYGLKIRGAKDVLIQGGTVSVTGTYGNGYRIEGNSNEVADNIVFRGTTASGNARAGYLISGNYPEATNIVYDRTVSQNNTGTNGHGYEVTGSTSATVKFFDAIASGNSGAGFVSGVSARFENVYSSGNSAEGIRLKLRSSLTHSTATLLNTTVKGNGDPQVSQTAPGIDLKVYNSLITASSKRQMSYSKKYPAYPTPGSGAFVDWKRNVTNGSNGSGYVVTFKDRTGTQRNCTSTQIHTCDATGDCDFDHEVTIDELLTMVGIANEEEPLSSCYQGDRNGDGAVSVEEITTATGIALNDDAHDSTSTSSPSFQSDQKHLSSGTTGWNSGGTPNSFGVPVCRANGCDADSHARPDSTSYDIGAYEGTGSQSTDSTCANLGPATCIAGGSRLLKQVASLDLGSSSQCYGREAEVPIELNGTAGDVAGLQLDILYDANLLAVTDDKPVCWLDIPLYHGEVYPNVLPTIGSQGRLRVIVVDIEKGQTFGNGPLMTCRFSVIGNSAETALSVEGLRVATEQGTLIDATSSSGIIQIRDVCSADGAREQVQ